MTAAVPTAVPDDFIAGDSWQFDLTVPDYPASAWTATAYFRGISSIDVVATASGDTFQFRKAASLTAALGAGVYRYFVKVTDGTNVYTVDQGEVEVVVNAATASATDLQTHAEKALALIEALIEGRVVNGTDAYAIFGRSIQNTPMEELRKMRAAYLSEVARQRFRGKLPATEVVFGRP